MAVTASDTSSVTGASITASGDHEAWPAVPAAAMLQATTPKAHPTITPEHALTAREVLDGCRAIADLYPFNPSMILWRGWEYAAYRRFTLPSPVLDIGCGDGRFFRFVFPACLDVVGVEMDANVAAHARASGVYRDVHQIPAHTLPASDERFGSAFANCSLEHMECLPSVLKGVYESLTPGAPFLCSVVTDRFVQWSPWPTLLEAAGDSDRGREVQRTHERFHHLANPLTREAWHRAFTDAGFVIEKEIPIIPEQTARLFLFVDQFVHLPRPDGEWFDPMVGYLERLPEFSSGFLRVLDGVLSMETDWQDAIGLVLYMRRPA